VIDAATLPGRPCALAAALELIGDRWALLAVREVSFGNHRFNEIARNTGAPRDRLAARLKSLVGAGILQRDEGYHLTEAGRELGPVIVSMLTWGNKWAVTSSGRRRCAPSAASWSGPARSPRSARSGAGTSPVPCPN
jgi:DNA-binding HxlR family transcriptional regulator